MARWAGKLLVAMLLLGAVSRGHAEEPAIPPPGPKERCPVCGMFVAPYPGWTAAARFAEGSVVYFDGPKDMLRYTYDVGRFDPARKDRQIGSLWVTEYYTAALMPAAGLYFVVGSDVLGPMGHELVPVRGEATAQTFRVDHRGAKVLPFADLSPAVVAELP